MLFIGILSYLGIPSHYSSFFLLICSLLFFAWTFFYKERYYYTQTTLLRLKNSYSGALVFASALSALFILLSLYLYHAYDPYNDTFTYISISDYLYDHPFSEPANPGAYFPLLTQPELYQKMGFRMGANFFLSFAQAITFTKRAYEIYPTVIAWTMILNVLAVYLGCRWLVRLPRFFAWSGAFIVAVSLNSPHYASLMGFFPQQMGTAFFIFTLSLLAKVLRTHAYMPTAKFKCEEYTHEKKLTFLLGLSTAFVISSYSEMFPVLVIILGLSFTLIRLPQIIRQKTFWKYFTLIGIFCITVACFANVEIYRMILALPTQLHAVVGWHIPFTVFQFFAMGAGIEVQPGFDLLPYTRFTYIASVLIALFFIGVFMQIKNYIRFSSVWLISIVIFALLIIYYTFFTFDPWTSERGHTWALFKIVGWMYPLVAIGIAAGMFTLIRAKSFAVVFLMVLLILLAPIHKNILQAKITPIQQFTFSSHPFDAYEQLSELVDQISPPNEPVEVQLNDSLYKHSEMLAYFLYPHPIIADWRRDGYIYPWLEEQYQFVQLTTPHLVLLPRESGQLNTRILPAGVIIKS